MDEVDGHDEHDEIDEGMHYDSDTEYDIIMDTTVTDIEGLEMFTKEYDKMKKNYITMPNLNKYEMTRVLCERTLQIEGGCIPYISGAERFTNAYAIASEELKQRKIPFIIRRPLPSLQGYEYWKLKDMIY